MQIEKMSKYIEPVCDNRSAGVGNRNRRRILMSLPRLKWLERQEDYVPWTLPPEPEPEPEEEKPGDKQSRHNGRYAAHRTSEHRDELTPQQRQVWALHLGGMSVVEIAARVGKSPNAASKMLCQARQKLGVGLK